MPETHLSPSTHPGLLSWYVQEKIQADHTPSNLGIFYANLRSGKLGGVVLQNGKGEVENFELSESPYKALVCVDTVLSTQSGSPVLLIGKIIFY